MRGLMLALCPLTVTLSAQCGLLKPCEGRMFAVKKLINRDDLCERYLLYRRCPRGRLEGDWLADVELYADQFQADYLSLLVRSARHREYRRRAREPARAQDVL